MTPKLFMVDAGHGGSDPGAPKGSDPCEARINLAVAQLLAMLLSDEGHGVILTRLVDATVSLDERVALEHRHRSDLFISLHCNSAEFEDGTINPQPHGIEIWTSPGETASDKAATAILQRIEQTFPERRYRKDLSDGDPDQEARFRVLTSTFGPAVLVEMEFASNPASCAWLEDPCVQHRMARAIADGALDWAMGRTNA